MGILCGQASVLIVPLFILPSCTDLKLYIASMKGWAENGWILQNSKEAVFYESNYYSRYVCRNSQKKVLRQDSCWCTGRDIWSSYLTKCKFIAINRWYISWECLWRCCQKKCVLWRDAAERRTGVDRLKVQCLWDMVMMVGSTFVF